MTTDMLKNKKEEFLTSSAKLNEKSVRRKWLSLDPISQVYLNKKWYAMGTTSFLQL